jgi:hypothetical protein
MVFGLALLSLFASCSKMSPVIQQKDKIVDHSTYDALTASEDFSTFDDKQLREVVAKVRTKRTLNFDWNSFWYSTSKKSSLSIKDKETVVDIFSLAAISCLESPASGFAILEVAKEGVVTQIKVMGDRSVQWLEQFYKVARDCNLERENQFVLMYTKLFENILKHDSKELRLAALNDLNDKIEKKISPTLAKEMREIFHEAGDSNLLGDEALSFDDQVVLVRTYDNVFPFRENRYLKDLIFENNSNLVKKHPELIKDFDKTALVLLSLDIDREQREALNSILMESWLQVADFKVSNEEEKIKAFNLKFEQAELLLSLKEKEFFASKNTLKVLNDLEIIIRNVEKSFFQLERPESFITKRDDSSLVLFLDLRLSKKTGLSLLKKSQAVKDISGLSDALRLFHSMFFFREKIKGQELLSKYCAWAPSKTISRIEASTDLINGCNTLTERKPNKQIKIKAVEFNMPLFSILTAHGQTLVLDSKRGDFSVFDLSQKQRPDPSLKISNLEDDAIAFPLVIGFELNEKFLNLQKDKVYYFPLNYIFKKAAPGVSHNESSSPDGLPGGSLVLNIDQQTEHFKAVLFSSGGEPAQALDGNEGGKGISYAFDASSLEDWINSTSQGEYFSLQILSAKNLKKLFSLMKRNGSNDIVVKLDPEYLGHVGEEAKLAFDRSLSLVRQRNLYLDSKYLESLSLDGLRSIQREIDLRIQSGDSLVKLPTLSHYFELPRGDKGIPQRLGTVGNDGGVIYE